MRTLRQSNFPIIRLVLVTALVMGCAVCAMPTKAQAQAPSGTNPGTQFTDLNIPNPTAMTCLKALPDGSPVRLVDKLICGISSTYINVEEPDRSAGIGIKPAGLPVPIDLAVGDLISVIGVMGTINGERVVVAQSFPSYRIQQGGKISSLGMSSAAILGWPMDIKYPDGPRYTGIFPAGLLVRIWGKVTSSGTLNGMWYVYLDDGWAKLDPLNMYYRDNDFATCRGVLVFSPKTMSPGDTIVSANGVLSTTGYDPSPQGPDGDEIIIPVVRVSYPDDLAIPGGQPVAKTTFTVQGRVRAVGASNPGVSVRVYSEGSSKVLSNITGNWSSFALDRVPDHAAVCASAPGYVTVTRVVNSTSGNVDMELIPSEAYVEINANKTSVSTCSEDRVLLSSRLRDCEGKPIPGRQMRLSTTKGIFADSNAKETIVTTDLCGTARAELATGSDGKGIAVVKAEDYPVRQASTSINIDFLGPEVTVSASPTLLQSPGFSVITASVSNGATFVPGATISFSTDRGIFQESGTSTYTATGGGSGKVQATLVVSDPGTAQVLVRYVNQCSYEICNWVLVAYPSAPWSSQQVQSSDPLIVDLNGNPGGKKNVVVTNAAGALVALNPDGSLLWLRDAYRYTSNTPACAILDSDRSGRPCIFIPAESDQSVSAYAHDAAPVAGWPTRTKYPFYNISCAIGDLNRDGSPEIVGGDECCFVFGWNPTGDWNGLGDTEDTPLWINLTGSPGIAIRGSSCAIGNVDTDPNGILDVVVGTASAPYGMYGFPGDAWGSYASSGLYLTGWPKASGNKVETSPALGDIDGDGRNDLAWTADDRSMHMWLSGSNGLVVVPLGSSTMCSPALADLDGDGKLDVIVGADSGKVFAFNWQGHALPGWEEGIRLNSNGNYAVQSSAVVGDVNGDHKVEVVIGCNDGFVYAIYKDGFNHKVNAVLTGPVAWARCCIPPSETSVSIPSTPAIDDVDNDGKVDVIAATSKGIYLIHPDAPYFQDQSLYPWPTFHHDNQRTGCATPPPAPVQASIQGIVSKNGAGVARAKISIFNADGTPVAKPKTPTVPRSYVMSAGSNYANAVGVGAYCINQLQPGVTYKLKVEAPGATVKWIDSVAVGNGLARVDVSL